MMPFCRAVTDFQLINLVSCSNLFFFFYDGGSLFVLKRVVVFCLSPCVESRRMFLAERTLINQIYCSGS